MAGSISDDPKADFLGNAGQSMYEGIFCPRLAFAVSEKRAFGILRFQLIDNGFGFGNEINHAGFPFPLGFIGRENHQIIMHVPGFDRAGFLRAAAGAVKKIQQEEQVLLSVLPNLGPLVGRVAHIPAFAAGLFHPGNRIAMEVILLDRPIQHPLDNPDRVILTGGIDPQPFMPFPDMVHFAAVPGESVFPRPQ